MCVMDLATYEAVVVTLILIVECVDLWFAHQLWTSKERARVARKAHKILHSMGLR